MRDYRLIQRHRINKVWREVGYVMAVDDTLGAWWVEQGIAERVEAPAMLAPRVAAPKVARAAIAAPAPRFKCCGWK